MANVKDRYSCCAPGQPVQSQILRIVCRSLTKKLVELLIKRNAIMFGYFNQVSLVCSR